MRLTKWLSFWTIGVFLLTLLIPGSSNAECRAPNTPWWSYVSTTCWEFPAKEVERHSLIEISQASASSVRNALSKIDEDILIEFENVEHALKKARSKSVGFFLSYKGVEQSDCGLYAVSFEGKIGKDTRLHVFGTIQEGKPDCREPMRRIGRGVAHIAKNKGKPSKYGFNRVVWTNHPNPKIANETEKRPINDLWLFDVIHGVPEDQKIAPWSGPNPFIQYPITTLEVQEGESLSKIAKDQTGSEANWKAIWALNAEKISDPNQIEKGMKIAVPSMITGWRTVNLSKYADSAEVAEKEYGSRLLAGLVEHMCKSDIVKKLSKDMCECDIPTYSDTREYKEVLMLPIPVE